MAKSDSEDSVSDRSELFLKKSLKAKKSLFLQPLMIIPPHPNRIAHVTLSYMIFLLSKQ